MVEVRSIGKKKFEVAFFFACNCLRLFTTAFFLCLRLPATTHDCLQPIQNCLYDRIGLLATACYNFTMLLFILHTTEKMGKKTGLAACLALFVAGQAPPTGDHAAVCCVCCLCVGCFCCVVYVLCICCVFSSLLCWRSYNYCRFPNLFVVCSWSCVVRVVVERTFPQKNRHISISMQGGWCIRWTGQL